MGQNNSLPSLSLARNSCWLLSLIALRVSLSVAEGQTTNMIDTQRFVGTVLANFSTWDANGDGRLDAKEITHALLNPQVQGDAAAAVATLKTVFRLDKNHRAPSFTSSYFQSHDPNLTVMATIFRNSEKRLHNSIGKPIFTKDGPVLAGMKQVDYGDCYLVAALGTIVVRDPDKISRMIERGTDPTQYRVKFPDGMSVTSSTLTEGELALPGPLTENGLWLRMLERAWGVRKMMRLSGKVDPTVEPTDVIDGPIPNDITIEALTGHRANRYDLAGSGAAVTPLADLRSALRDAVRDHHPMTADIVTAAVPGMVAHHVYAVLNYNSQADTISLWNPLAPDFTPSGPEGRANGYKTDKGRFQISLTDFQAIFEDLKIETAQEKTAEAKSLIH